MTIEEMRQRKTELAYTNEMIAQKSGVPLSTVQKVFAGITAHPRYETLRALERALTEGQGKDGQPWDRDSDRRFRYLTSSDSGDFGQRDTGRMAYSSEDAAYNISDPAPTMLREESAVYQAKRQGEYTLEDYYALPEDVRAELIDGEIFIMEAPTSIHQAIITEIWGTLRAYIRSQNGTCMPFASPLDVQLDCDDRTMLQPDVLVICDRSKVIKRCIYGAPDLAIEILSPSTRSKDMFLKLNKYKNAGVKEYWMVDPDKKQIIVYDFQHDDNVSIYGFEDRVPVGIFDGQCSVDFREIYDYIGFLYE